MEARSVYSNLKLLLQNEVWLKKSKAFSGLDSLRAHPTIRKRSAITCFRHAPARGCQLWAETHLTPHLTLEISTGLACIPRTNTKAAGRAHRSFDLFERPWPRTWVLKPQLSWEPKKTPAVHPTSFHTEGIRTDLRIVWAPLKTASSNPKRVGRRGIRSSKKREPFQDKKSRL